MEIFIMSLRKRIKEIGKTRGSIVELGVFFFFFFLFKKTNGKKLKQKQKLLFRFAIPAPKFVFWVLKLLIDASLVFQRGGGQAIRIEACMTAKWLGYPSGSDPVGINLPCFLIFPFSKKIKKKL